jgi:hypothetical protein
MITKISITPECYLASYKISCVALPSVCSGVSKLIGQIKILGEKYKRNTGWEKEILISLMNCNIFVAISVLTLLIHNLKLSHLQKLW